MKRKPASIEEYAARVVAAAPPLTPAQRRRIAGLLAAAPREIAKAAA